ncbi:MAG: hypothetical protein EAX95_02375 [Candidatus Thorarchaeota archaeon]|nr:hypothetical protein [Candidatus Thorarchaeota archaeon]
MTQATELKTKYTKLISAEVSPTGFNEAGEAVSILFENNWVRILVIRTNVSSDITIEVESSLPREPVGQNDGLSPESILNGAIRHLYYLKELESIGFALDVIRQDCLWTASKTFSESVAASVFQKLCPPECS